MKVGDPVVIYNLRSIGSYGSKVSCLGKVLEHITDTLCEVKTSCADYSTTRHPAHLYALDDTPVTCPDCKSSLDYLTAIVEGE